MAFLPLFSQGKLITLLLERTADGKSRGFGFAEFASAKAARYAFNLLEGKQWSISGNRLELKLESSAAGPGMNLPGDTLYIKNCATTKEDVRDAFADFGVELQDIDVMSAWLLTSMHHPLQASTPY